MALKTTSHATFLRLTRASLESPYIHNEGKIAGSGGMY